jgi:hypothetical protein
MRRLYDDGGTVKRKKRTEKKRWGDRCQVNDLEHISYQKEKELIDDRVSEMCDCFCFCYRSAHMYIIGFCVFYYKDQQFFLCYDLV